VLPEQHSLSSVQAPPVFTQHAPPLQVLPRQHSAVVVHAVPALLQGWHEPLLQMFEQQSLARLHVVASAEQVPQRFS
jgi:hypothetical protein